MSLNYHHTRQLMTCVQTSAAQINAHEDLEIKSHTNKDKTAQTKRHSAADWKGHKLSSKPVNLRAKKEKKNPILLCPSTAGINRY